MLTQTVTKNLSVLFVVVALFLTGCGTSGIGASNPGDAVVESRTTDNPGLLFEETKEEATLAPTDTGSTKVAGKADGDYAAGSESIAVETEEVAAYKAMPTEIDSPSPALDESSSLFERGTEESAEVEIALQTGPLRAGEVDDNSQWDDYLLYRRGYYGPPIHQRDINERYVIEVTDGQGFPILGATVRAALPGQKQQEIFNATTMANGQVLFHPLALNAPLDHIDQFKIEVEKNDVSRRFTLTRFQAQPATSVTESWSVSLNAPQPQAESLNLDVLFLVDATGSMADEIQKIQNTIFDVSAQIDALPENPNVRYGLVTYRDRDDSYITRTYNFTPDVRDFSKNLNTVRADGGGDYPESLNEGLHNALHNVEWRGKEAVKLVFLIADAPPHLDYAQDYDYAVEMEFAAQKGIKIHPIASSGLDDQGEYIFRQIAQYTQGQFVFLTYEGSNNGGSPGDVTTHHIEDYSVENLDKLLVRLVEEELAHQNRQLAQAQ